MKWSIISVEVIRLLHDAYLGPEQFKLGIRRHIFQHNHRLVDASDLWRDLKGDSDLPVDKFIETWTEQAGHPAVTIRPTSNSLVRRMILEQRRDRSSSSPAENKHEKGTWIVPVTIRVSNGADVEQVMTYYLSEPTMEIDLPPWFKFRRGPKHWLKVNENYRGFYRVEYGGNLLQQRLEEPYKAKKLSSNNRIGLINDVMVRFENDPAALPKFYEVLKWNQGELDGAVLGQVARATHSLSNRVDLRSELLAPAFHKYGLQNELFQHAKSPHTLGAMDIEGLIKAYDILLELEYAPLVGAALDKFDREGNTMAPRIRGLVYKIVALRGSPNLTWRLISFLNRNVNDEEEKMRISAALRLVPAPTESQFNVAQ